VTTADVDYLLLTKDWLTHLIGLEIKEQELDQDIEKLCEAAIERKLTAPTTTESIIKEESSIISEKTDTPSEIPPIEPVAIIPESDPEPTTERAVEAREKNGVPAIERRQMTREMVVGDMQRVSTQSLDKLLNLSGELYVKGTSTDEIKESMLRTLKTVSELGLRCRMLLNLKNEAFSEEEESLSNLVEEIHNKSDVLKGMIEPLYHRLDEYGTQIQYLTESLKDEVMVARMVPLSQLFDTFPRMVRELSKVLGKKVQWICTGENTRIDKAIAESLKTPLDHLVRNAVDHGIEAAEERKKRGKPLKGKITLSAFHQGDQVIIRLEDDGAGIDHDTIRQKIVEQNRLSEDKAEQLLESELMDFIFLPGFTTKDKVTSTSGRGVGMDVVKTQIEKINGRIRVSSELGKSTTFNLFLPLTLAITRTLLLESKKQIYAFPTSLVGEYIHIFPNQIKKIGGKPAIVHNDRIIAVSWLDQIMGFSHDFRDPDHSYPTLIFQAGEDEVAIIADKFVGEGEIVIKPLDSRLKKVQNLIGATILNSGRFALVIDVVDLVHTIQETQFISSHEKSQPKKVARKRILVVEDSLTIREMERKVLQNAKYEVEVAVDGLDGLNKVKRQPFDLIISDIDMPRMNGLELTRTLKSDIKYKKIPIVIVSYKDRPEDKKKGLEVGADHYIAKSQFDNNQFLEIINRLI